jgi:uncharacterized protein YbbC (DUF1343 family)
VGRGTDRAFQQVGAPWLAGGALADTLNGYGIPGVRFDPVEFTPDSPGDDKFGGETVQGVRFVALGPDYDPTRAAVAALLEARRLSGERWGWRASHFDRLAGTDRLRRGITDGQDLASLTAGWSAEVDGFRELRAPYLLY